MCGIAGIVHKDGQRVSLPMLQAMAATLRHRGPDGEGFWVDTKCGSVGFAHRRLSVIDLATGAQPMSTPDGVLHITFNGEIYNYRSLRELLSRAGAEFCTASDTEVILRGYQMYGPDVLSKLRGMFALALWDTNAGRLLLARDRLGKKPLYYYEDDAVLVFASEPKAIFATRLVRPEVNPGAIDSYLMHQYVPHQQCAFKKLKKLAPGELLTLEAKPGSRSQLRSYWRLQTNIDTHTPEPEWIERIRSAVFNSVELRMISDVPLGAFLSGGVDSSIVVAVMAQLSRVPVKTFSIGFKERLYNETQFARLVATRYGTAHYETVVEPDAAGILPKLAHHFDEPFGDPSAIPTWHLAEMTRRQVTVALSGDGGDELFGGYDRYTAIRIAGTISALPQSLRKAASSLVAALIPPSAEIKSRRFRARRFLRALGVTPEESYLQWIAITEQARRNALFTRDFAKQCASNAPEQWFVEWMNQAKENDLITRASYADCKQYLPDDLLAKADICSMAHGLEVRNPLIDHALVELAFAMPAHFKIRGRVKKYLLKRAFADLLPQEIAKRGKMGFGVPVNDWFRAELREAARDLLLSAPARTRGVLNPDAVELLLREHEEKRANHGHLLWMLMMLEHWFRAKIENAG